jgi:hypothetical protein
MAEMGIPAIAASTSAPTYRLERITATGSITGPPPAGAAAACRLASGTAPLLGLLESAIRCSLSSDESDEPATSRSWRAKLMPQSEGSPKAGPSARCRT